MILVTGATGFLGTELVQQLTSQGKSVIATRRKSTPIPTVLANNPFIDWRYADINALSDLEDALTDVTQVFHCAALVSFQKKDKERLFKTNIEGTANLVNLCLAQNIRLLHVSSVAALGEASKGNIQLTENNYWEYQPKANNYSLSKYHSEMEVWRGIAEGLDAIIVNPSIIIGASAGFTGSGTLFKIAKQGISFYTSGSSGFVHVSDVAACMILLMQRTDLKSERYILNSENLSYRQLFTEMANSFGTKAPHWLARRWMLAIAWRMSQFTTALGISANSLTKETARSSTKQSFYSNKKIKQTLNYNFKPIKQSIAEICSVLNK